METRDQSADAVRNDEHAMALAHERAIGHSVDGRFFDAHNAVIRTGQRAEQPAESHRARSRHHAERRRALPARLALCPQRAAGAHHPAPDRAAAEATAGSTPRTGAPSSTTASARTSGCRASMS